MTDISEAAREYMRQLGKRARELHPITTGKARAMQQRSVEARKRNRAKRQAEHGQNQEQS